MPHPRHWFAGVDLPQRLAVGFSGGADSTALLLALAAAGHQVVAWHVDHGWHAGSVRVADALQAKAAGWGIEFHRVRLDPPSGKNREAEARKARFAQFVAWGEAQGIATLCLAQQRNDQAETVCMRLLQGAGPAGCAGMRAGRLWQGLNIVRPLLHIGRGEVEQVLLAAGVDWVEDASNRDTTLLRNRIRHQLFPAARSAGIDPVELFCRWQAQAVRLSAQLQWLADEIGLEMRQGAAVVGWDAWQSSPAAVRAVVLQRMSASLFGEGAVLGRRHILLAEAWRGQGGRAGIDLTRSRLFRDREYLHLARAEVSLPDMLR
ncbi:MAG: tRNA lysidine(34) synthetase TilS [Zetaproteobacteria bacterium CG2_30_59_37]|nr:MAG: tRNA lysidine(34) synthetase TilS [Zetaproteobacteria bacterium CG2_30_59_37]